jgi:hypothetical protein
MSKIPPIGDGIVGGKSGKSHIHETENSRALAERYIIVKNIKRKEVKRDEGNQR